MKKFLTIVCVVVIGFCFINSAAAVEWHTANSTRVGWDAVTKSSDGSVTFDPAEITYQVYIVNSATDPQKTNPVKIGAPISGTEETITLNVEGRYIAGVSAIRTVDGTRIGESDIAWSDQTPNPWGIQFYAIPPSPTGISPK